ncbi:DUF2255 family protein [Actinomadura sp. LD22]|uniref:DUF2255 family protein n=1 Tax=Actinomadura physcomitrii TaxID=2650748 RepID=A0A6I4MNB8_9ACTN|nr:DUF2255 family protein [Actinomadura physcomitrii]MWA05407.1 DUF2255 family protein [Actinomadura physcomitrii]
MAAWTSDELDRIGDATELDLQSARDDGTLRDPVTMWVVRVGDEVFVRSMNGPDGAWYRGTQTRRQGRVTADGVTKDVAFDDTDHDLDADIDEVYRTKYQRYGANIVGGVVNSASREATIKLTPRS